LFMWYIAQRPYAPKPSAQKPSAQKPSAQMPSTQMPSTQMPSTQMPSAQKPIAQKPIAQKPYAVFDYEDFGPQAMAWERLGMQWWQWKSYGDDDPAHKDDIKVVVYAGVPLDEVKKVYPVDEARKKDYRYFAYDDALKYLERHIRELESQKAQWAVEVRNRLVRTREMILQEVKHEN
jgi:hypothetical protein